MCDVAGISCRFENRRVASLIEELSVLPNRSAPVSNVEIDHGSSCSQLCRLNSAADVVKPFALASHCIKLLLIPVRLECLTQNIPGSQADVLKRSKLFFNKITVVHDRHIA